MSQRQASGLRNTGNRSCSAICKMQQQTGADPASNFRGGRFQ